MILYVVVPFQKNGRPEHGRSKSIEHRRVFYQYPYGVGKMNKLISAFKQGSAKFVRDEEGAQVVEYALIIAVVSIVLVLALSKLGTGTIFTDFITRVTKCLNSAVCV